MLRAALVACLCLSGVQAQALSCMRPNLGDAFNSFHDAPERYTLAVGRLTARAGDSPQAERGVPTRAEARFTGRTITAKGTGQALDIPVTVQTSCVASWCGGVPETHRPLIVFLRHDGPSRVLDIPACPNGNASVDAPGRVDLLRKCVVAGRCPDSVIRAFDRK